MTWTNKRPEVEGWYWVKRYPNSDPYPVKVWISSTSAVLFQDIDDWGSFCTYNVNDREYKDAQWSGPIKEPEEVRGKGGGG